MLIKGKTVYAVDFDGTLDMSDIFPNIDIPRMNLIRFLRNEKEKGHCELILWTCRENKELQQAIDWCKNYGLYFDTVNENLPELIRKYRCRSRKVAADIYIDEKSLNPQTSLKY